MEASVFAAGYMTKERKKEAASVGEKKASKREGKRDGSGIPVTYLHLDLDTCLPEHE